VGLGYGLLLLARRLRVSLANGYAASLQDMSFLLAGLIEGKMG
jgi:hypothetical protein